MTDISAYPLPFESSRVVPASKSRPVPFAKPRTLREMEMMQCSAHIREKKPEWFVKMNDAGIVDTWVREADSLVGEGLRTRLREAVRVVEEVPEAELDWHPGSDGQVLDLVHPSLFCLVREASGGPERAWKTPATHRSARYEFSASTLSRTVNSPP